MSGIRLSAAVWLLHGADFDSRVLSMHSMLGTGRGCQRDAEAVCMEEQE